MPEIAVSFRYKEPEYTNKVKPLLQKLEQLEKEAQKVVDEINSLTLSFEVKTSNYVQPPED